MSLVGDRAFATLQYLLPKHWMSRVFYRATRSTTPWFKNRIIKMFLSGYRVNMEEAAVTDAFAYPSFNAFFTRSLKAESRPIASDPDAFVSPVDGTVSQAGEIDGEKVFQAKGRDFSLEELLGDAALAQKYAGGSFATIYLAPYNYHRIHMPFGGRVQSTIYVPGALFSVNASTARTVPRLFARNERVICDFLSDRGPFAMAYIGALHVGSMETTWCGEINPLPRIRKQPLLITTGIGTLLRKGDEAGRFNMGSTVVIVTPKSFVQWNSALQAGATVKMGESIGTVRKTAAVV